MAPIKSLPEQLPAPPETKKNGRRSRRHRRVLWSAAGLAITGLLGTAAGAQFYRDHQPQTYKPGEALADITHTLDCFTAHAVGTRCAPDTPRHSAALLRTRDRVLPAFALDARLIAVRL